uniref:Uncharacterized protein n=1 Tax=Candidatus Kentrum sp. TUN TaxID=2126343 RepID=A0A450ZSJ6_9GAMM|nr:MAG: hypothetical protein BECKTUN1418D_GA0071000_105215 [Candidatus Kentron sp. TUN]VFK58672.1 MAG: hypothetical protein BECKTUN1418F_GA0071002_11505 [Candidatus Kentron sp. TUN]
MANKRLSIRKIQKVLRLACEQGLGIQAICVKLHRLRWEIIYAVPRWRDLPGLCRLISIKQP